jgi:hypothetical protein
MTEASRTALQQLNDCLFDLVDVVGQQGNNKRMRCKKCTHNFSGYAGRIHDYLISKAGAVRGCTFSESNDKREELDELDRLVDALPKANKRRAVDVASTENASSSGLQQMSIQQSMQGAGKQGVDQALADWVYETGIQAAQEPNTVV